MNGMEIMSFALREIPPMVEELLVKRDGEKKTWVRMRSIKRTIHARVFTQEDETAKPVVPIAVSDVGNTGPASIPLMLCTNHRNYKESSASKSDLLWVWGRFIMGIMFT